MEGSNVTPSRLKCISELRGELTCGICLDLCVKPCSTPCGHNFCQRCLQTLFSMSNTECPKCRSKIDPHCGAQVNSALWNCIQLLFPQVEQKSPIQWNFTPRQVDSPQSSNTFSNAGLMLQVSVPDFGDLTGEGPVLDVRNRLPRTNYDSDNDSVDLMHVQHQNEPSTPTFTTARALWQSRNELIPYAA